MQVFVLNSGSSSVKCAVFQHEKRIFSGFIERIGFNDARVQYKDFVGNIQEDYIESVLNHHQALLVIANTLKKLQFKIEAIGHRIVHGGEKFSEPVIVNEEVKKYIRDCIVLAPLHNPYNLLGIEICEQYFPGITNVAVFDTAFHSTIPKESAIYPLPYEYYVKYKIRKYGFHGTSHQYLMLKASELLNKSPENLKIITCHLGNGASITAIKNGKSVDTSMGFTPTAGLMMGTRCGDVDPSAIIYLQQVENISARDMEVVITKKSGLLGVSGISADMREIVFNIDKSTRAKLAFKMYCYYVKKYIASYIGILNGVDCIVFSAGVGENSPRVREEILKNMENLGIIIDKEKNFSTVGKDGIISADESQVKVMVLRTDEELMIAKITAQLAKV
ncbi:MAG: acetate kinase [Endomicrobia bacterium]|nr:acetate kinase [Endomicrobiia bacterium]